MKGFQILNCLLARQFTSQTEHNSEARMVHLYLITEPGTSQGVTVPLTQQVPVLGSRSTSQFPGLTEAQVVNV